MRYAIVRKYVKCVAAFREPNFQLPVKAVDVLEGIYRALHPRYSIELKDLQSWGGTSFADVKVTVSALGGRAKLEFTPAAMAVEVQDVVTGSRDDTGMIQDLMVIAEDTVLSKLPGTVIQHYSIRTLAWLKVEDGKDAAERLLSERGDAVLQLAQGHYQSWLRQYSFEVNLTDRKGKDLSLLLQRSRFPDESDLFARCEYIVSDRGEGMEGIGATLVSAFAERDMLLNQVGLKMKDA